MTEADSTYEAKLAELTADLDRWIEEAGSEGLRGTHAFGMTGKALKHFERLVRARLEGIEDPHPQHAGPDAKPDRRTLGQLLDRLRSLDRQRRLMDGRRAFTTAEGNLVNSVISRRNDFIHGGGDVDGVKLMIDMQRLLKSKGFSADSA